MEKSHDSIVQYTGTLRTMCSAGRKYLKFADIFNFAPREAMFSWDVGMYMNGKMLPNPCSASAWFEASLIPDPPRCVRKTNKKNRRKKISEI